MSYAYLSTKLLSTVLWLRRPSFESDLGLCNGIRKDIVRWFKVNTLKVNTALEAGVFSKKTSTWPHSSAHLPHPPPATSMGQAPTAGAAWSEGHIPRPVRNGSAVLS